MSEKRRPCLKCAAKGWRDSMYDHETRDHDRLLAEAGAKGEEDAKGSDHVNVGTGTTQRSDGLDGGRLGSVDAGTHREHAMSQGFALVPDGDARIGGGLEVACATDEQRDPDQIGRDHGGMGVVANEGLTPAPTWADLARMSAEHEERASKPPKAIRETEDGAPGFDIDTIAQEAAQYGPGMFGYFLWLDARCIDVGMSPASPWWRWSLERYFASGKRWGVWQVGRGAGKSTFLERVTAAIAMFAERFVPPGQRWELPYVSVGPEDANRRIRGIEATLTRALHLEVKALTSPRAHIDLEDIRANPIKIASVAGTIGNLSGLNAIGLLIDEAAKLHDKSTNANPLSEIIASVISAFRARANIYAIVCSSAMWRSGAFWELIEQGDTETNCVARIGAAFLPDALAGLEAVAQWEEQGDARVMRAPDPVAAKAIRAHAATLTAESPAVPTWVANPMYGPTPAEAAIVTRREVQALPERILNGRARHDVWLREIASVPMVGEDDGVDFSEQCLFAAEVGEYLDRVRGFAPSQQRRTVQSHPLAGPGDARYAGARQAPEGMRQTWRTRKVM